MHEGKMVFSQVMAMLPWRRFQTCIDRYQGDKKIKSFHCHEFFRVMMFAPIRIGIHYLQISFLLGFFCYARTIEEKTISSSILFRETAHRAAFVKYEYKFG